MDRTWRLVPPTSTYPRLHTSSSGTPRLIQNVDPLTWVDALVHREAASADLVIPFLVRSVEVDARRPGRTCWLSF